MNSKNLNKIIEEALAIEAEDAKEAGALGYMARVFTQASLPHSKIKESEYKRTNGSLTMTVISPSDIGVPYGSYPRLLMSWITTEVVKKKEPVLTLGASLSAFMNELGLIPTGGRWGTIPRLREQMVRLFSSSVSCHYRDESRDVGIGLRVAKTYDLWWDPKNPNQSNLWQSTVTLSQDFFDEIVDRPIPVDLRVLKTIKQSAMKLDIYCWLTHRMSYLTKQTEIRWELLQDQLGTGYTRTRAFKEAFIEHLKGVLLCYPASIKINDNGIILVPSKTHVKMLTRE